MIDKIYIENYKCINKQEFDLPNLTVFTGLNSTGKTSVLQTILLQSLTYSKTTSGNFFSLMDFVSLRNKYNNAKEVKITTYNKNKKVLESTLIQNELSTTFYDENGEKLEYEENFYYLSANRKGQEDISEFTTEQKSGINGSYLFGYFDRNKSNQIYKKIVKFDVAPTLTAQLDNWLRYILDIDLRLITEKITADKVKVSFHSDGLDNLSPSNVGSGNSFVAKVLILCLMCKAKDIVVIENPEIHLHPKAQSRLGDFFAFIASNGIKVILETHSEHLINKIRYNVFKKDIKHKDVMIYYKQSIREDFICFKVSDKGKFIDIKEKETSFPAGFFDSTLKELLEIG